MYWLAQGFLLGVELEVIRGPLKEVGLDEAGMEKLIKAAHEMCPYSRATSGNIVSCSSTGCEGGRR